MIYSSSTQLFSKDFDTDLTDMNFHTLGKKILGTIRSGKLHKIQSE